MIPLIPIIVKKYYETHKTQSFFLSNKWRVQILIRTTTLFPILVSGSFFCLENWVMGNFPLYLEESGRAIAFNSIDR